MSRSISDGCSVGTISRQDVENKSQEYRVPLKISCVVHNYLPYCHLANQSLTNLESIKLNDYSRLRVLELQGNDLTDITPLSIFGTTLELLNISNNKLTKLPSHTFWLKFQKLIILYLDCNMISSWKDMNGVTGCPSLMWLSILNNSFSSKKFSRQLIIQKMPQIKLLNNLVVHDVERLNPLGYSDWLMTQTEIYKQREMPTSFSEYVNGFSDADHALSYCRHVSNKLLDLWLQTCPSIIIQRTIRGYLSRAFRFPHCKRALQLIIKLQSLTRGFLERRLIERQLKIYARSKPSALEIGDQSKSFLLPIVNRICLKKFITAVQAWKSRFQSQRRALAIQKIKNFFIFAMHVIRQRRREIIKSGKKLYIYYTAEFEDELLKIARKYLDHDPFVIGISSSELQKTLERRCFNSGISIISHRRLNIKAKPVKFVTPPFEVKYKNATHRHNHSAYNRYSVQQQGLKSSTCLKNNINPYTIQIVGTNSKNQSPNGLHVTKQLSNSSNSLPDHVSLCQTHVLLRAFVENRQVRDHLLIEEKKLLQDDISHLRNMNGVLPKHYAHQISLTNEQISTRSITPKQFCVDITAAFYPLAAAANRRLVRELEIRLSYCNKAILQNCLNHIKRKNSQLKRHNHNAFHPQSGLLSIISENIKARGIPLTPRQKFFFQTRSRNSVGVESYHMVNEPSNSYPMLKVFIPWSVDMYLSLLKDIKIVINGQLNQCNGFSSYHEEIIIQLAVLQIQTSWRRAKAQKHLKYHVLQIKRRRACICIQRCWRWAVGIHRRLKFYRTALTLSASISSPTLFMEKDVFDLVMSNEGCQWTTILNTLNPFPLHNLEICVPFNGKVSLRVPKHNSKDSVCPDHKMSKNCSKVACDDKEHISSQAQYVAEDMEFIKPLMESSYCKNYKSNILQAKERLKTFPVWMNIAPPLDTSIEESIFKLPAYTTSPALLLKVNVTIELTNIEREISGYVLHANTIHNHVNTHACNNQQVCPSFHIVRKIEESYERVRKVALKVFTSNNSILKQSYSSQNSLHACPNELATKKDAIANCSLPTLGLLHSRDIIKITCTSVEDARHRALALLAKSYNPTTGSYCQMHSIEWLLGVALFQHQWALRQVTTDEELKQLETDQKEWLGCQISTSWLALIQSKLQLRIDTPEITNNTGRVCTTSVEKNGLYQYPTRPASRSLIKNSLNSSKPIKISMPPTKTTKYQQKECEDEKSSNQQNAIIAYCNRHSQAIVLSPVQERPHKTNLVIPPLKSSDSNHIRRLSRHNRLCQSNYNNQVSFDSKIASENIESKTSKSNDFRIASETYNTTFDTQALWKRMHVRELREERERGQEAAIVDRRILQREKTAEIAGHRLEVHVALRRRKFQDYLNLLHSQENRDRQHVAAKHNKLTKAFENAFVQQAGAISRRSSRRKVKFKQ